MKRIVSSLATNLSTLVLLAGAAAVTVGAGMIFLPMHIPVLLCGLACGWPYGLICGVPVPLQAVSVWRQYYEWMGRDAKVRMIDARKKK